MTTTWHLGSMNDCLFIIDKRPCHNEDGCFDDCPNAPDLVLNVAALTHEQAQTIVDAHNAALVPAANVRTLLAEKEREIFNRHLITDEELEVIAAAKNCQEMCLLVEQSNSHDRLKTALDALRASERHG